jgi:uncharacterized repeat protein (TIGR03803 family)
MHSKRFWYFMTSAVVAFLAAATVIDTATAASNHQVLFNFTGGHDGGNAATDLVFDSAGNGYGTTVVGGDAGCGTIFKVTPAAHGQWTETKLWSFSCFNDGKNPHGGVTLDAAGNIYGTTVAGGEGFCTGDGCGVVFELTRDGNMQTLYSFSGENDGFGPGGRVVFDKSGNLYGTAPDGGKHGMGVVYQLSFHNNSWQQTVIHAFTGRNDGAVGSLGPLLIDQSGNIYGIAELGGSHQAGTAYKISPVGGMWVFKTIFAFRGSPDAGFPYGGLIPDQAGNLYGTTYYGGQFGLGSVYELRPVGTGYQERLLYSFQGGADGSSPTTTLILGGSGPVAHLFGTTSAGGNTCDCGTIFKVGIHTRSESVIYRFGSSQSDGAYPYYSLSMDMNGDLVTSTVAGGTFGQGVLFGIRP